MWPTISCISNSNLRVCGSISSSVRPSTSCASRLARAMSAFRRRVQISVLPEMARLLCVSLEALFGEEAIDMVPRKRGPASRLEQQIQIISQLPRAKQKLVSEMLEAVIAQAQQ
ncbi:MULTISPECIES: transcriptional regulator [unclassified Photorhabdus]|uniref:transcriptional regulator n=1 Tax=unclassified Photorhabdus TaxID=2620880 RepID=UPI0018643534|nr:MULTISPECIES: transcriptional regulator [unclassified Photorhabdus]